METGARLLIVGWDGATWDVADPLIAAGRLPHLARLVREGVRAPLNSTTPPMTLPSWSSFLTGATPGVHGIYDFVRRDERYRLEFTNSTHRRIPTLHQWLSTQGHRVASIAVPTTYPPQPVDGFVISGFDSPVATNIDGSFVHPASLYPELVERFGGMAFADFQELSIGPDWHREARAALLREIPRKENIAKWLMERERFEALMVLFGETDTASHHFWMFHDADSPRFDGQRAKELGSTIEEVYEAADAALGRLIEAAAPDLVCVVSDHGFGGAGTRALYLNRFLEAQGWLTYRQGAERAVDGHRQGSSTADRVKGAALKWLPGRVQEQLVRRMPARLLSRVESASRYGNIDFERTLAWSDEMNYAATINLNLEGRDVLGQVTDRAAVVGQLREQLLAWRIEGQPVVREVLDGLEVFGANAAPGAPDVVLELHQPGGYTYTLLPSARAQRGQLWRDFKPSEYPGGKGLGMNGTHRQHGVLVLHGEGVGRGQVEASMWDCAPTLLTLLGHDLPDHMDGRVLQRAFAKPIRPTYVASRIASTSETSLSREDAAAVRERLRSLGYL